MCQPLAASTLEMKLLLVEDDAPLVAALEKGLHGAGFAVDAVGSAEDALERLGLNEYDAMLLDLGLPGADGMTLLRVLRERAIGMPVLILTARGDVADRVAGLDGGADDYLLKPFAFPELLARVRALLRRGVPVVPAVLQVADLKVDPARFEALRSGTALSLTAKEFAI